jgi:hypothetical protein
VSKSACGRTNFLQFARFLAVVAYLYAASPARSSILQYTFSGVGSGVLGGQVFQNKSVTITSILDTSQLINFGNGQYLMPDYQGANLSIAGFAPIRFETPTAIFFVEYSDILGLVGIDPLGNQSTLAALGPTTPISGPYYLDAPIGPINGYNFANGDTDTYATSGGLLELGSWFPNFTVSSVPDESDTLLLFAAGVFSCGLMRVRLKTKSLT